MSQMLTLVISHKNLIYRLINSRNTVCLASNRTEYLPYINGKKISVRALNIVCSRNAISQYEQTEPLVKLRQSPMF